MIMSLVVNTNREVLLSEYGSHVFTGVVLEDFQTQAVRYVLLLYRPRSMFAPNHSWCSGWNVSWGIFARKLFSAGGRYVSHVVFPTLHTYLTFTLRTTFPDRSTRLTRYRDFITHSILYCTSRMASPWVPIGQHTPDLWIVCLYPQSYVSSIQIVSILSYGLTWFLDR